MTISERIKHINDELKQNEPGSTTTDMKGRTGYSPQWIIDLMNKHFPQLWGFDELHSEIFDQGDRSVRSISNMRVWLLNEDGEKLAFQPTAWGEGTQAGNAQGDCRKAAQTDAIKKALSYFSIGNRAYHGLLKGKLV